MALFPMFVNITDKRCLVVGGGKVAARKIRTLVSYDADVVVVAEEIRPEIRTMLPEASCMEGPVRREVIEVLLDKAVLAVAATSDRALNHWVFERCRAFGIPVNVADAPEECTFTFPAVVRKGSVSVGINSGTDSPALTRGIRRRTEQALPDFLSEAADRFGELRLYVRTHFPKRADRQAILEKVADRCFEEDRMLTEQEITEILREYRANEAKSD